MQYEVRYVAISTYYHDYLGVKMTKEEARRMGITLESPDPVRHPDHRVLATSWEHWEAALHAEHGTHAKAVITTFWVSSLQKHKSILVS